MNPFGDPRKMMKQLQQAQERMQAEIAALVVEATSGGGMVKVEVDGQKQLLRLTIDPEVVSKDDVEMLQDLVVAAVNEASRKVDEQIQEKVGGLTGGMKIPGLTLTCGVSDSARHPERAGWGRSAKDPSIEGSSRELLRPRAATRPEDLLRFATERSFVARPGTKLLR